MIASGEFLKSQMNLRRLRLRMNRRLKAEVG
jgi:hypothetical protein